MENYIDSAYDLLNKNRKLLPDCSDNHQFLGARLQIAATILPEFTNDLAEFSNLYILGNVLTAEEKRLLPIINSNLIISFLLCL